MRYTNVPSPVGELLVAASDQGLSTIVFETWRHGPADGDRASWERDDGRGPAGEILAAARTQLGEYFARTRTTFDLPLDLSGTPFQLEVWEALRQIPYGSTISYGELARRVRSPNGSRAVGAANGRNPVVVVVPCHRVIGANGDLTGFGGGMERKRWLLEHEGGVKDLFD